MSEAAHPVRGPLLPLPGFMPDAVSYALRLTLAMLLAYLVGFTIQLDSASSAGVCVAIVMQPSPGMAMSKAFYRILGTVVGGAAALVVLSLFPQDRTLLLLAFALWLGACTYVASLLRDFRAYGAVLAGYTVAVIAIGQIDTPDAALLATLDRVAAILIGIVCVALVNSVFVVASAHAQLEADLTRQLTELRGIALGALAGDRPISDGACLQRASDILALRTQATYASAELADGLRRNHASESTIAALLGMLAASREFDHALRLAPAASPAARAFLGAAATAIRIGGPLPPPGPLPAEPHDALLTERAASLAAEHRAAQAWLLATTTGTMAEAAPRIRLRSDPDHVAAMLNVIRTMIAVGLGAAFCILGNSSGVTLLLIQLSAFTALIGLQPNPSAAAETFLGPLPFAAVLTGVIAFLALPQSSGFVPFALAVGAGVFVLGLASRHPRTAKFGPALLIDFTILLSPSNQQQFNLSTFANTTVQLALAAIFMIVAFRLVLPVQPRRRLLRVADKIMRSLRRALRQGCPRGQATQLSRSFDRLSQALVWAGARRPGRHAVLGRLCRLAELDAAACRAWQGLRDAGPMADQVPAGRWGLAGAGPEGMERAARALLADPRAGDAPGAVLRAVSGLHGASLLLREQGHALHRYGVLED